LLQSCFLPDVASGEQSRRIEEEHEWPLNHFHREVLLGIDLAEQAQSSLAMSLFEPARRFLSQAEKRYKNALHIIVISEGLTAWQRQEFRSELAALMQALAVLHQRIHQPRSSPAHAAAMRNSEKQAPNHDTGGMVHDPDIFRKELTASGDLLLRALELENSLAGLHPESGTPEVRAKWQEARRFVESPQKSYDEAPRRYREAVARSFQERAERLSKSTILLLEDEQMIANLLKKMLESEGATVLWANDGDEALTLCRQHRGEIRLVVADVILRSGALGVEIAHRLAKLEPDLAVLLISGYPKEHLENRGLLDPVKMPFRKAAFLMKPFSAATLQERIRELSS
jgi:CheY-like chemotaxis protein